MGYGIVLQGETIGFFLSSVIGSENEGKISLTQCLEYTVLLKKIAQEGCKWGAENASQ
jgi:hypothetical protein